MTFRMAVQSRNGLWQEISPESPVPVSVVGQHAQLDYIHDALLAKIDEVIDRVGEDAVILDGDIQSLKPLLGEIIKGVSQPAVFRVEVPSDIIADVTEHIDAFGELIRHEAFVTAQTLFAENRLWRKIVIGAISIQTFIIVLTLVILALVERF